MHGGSHVAVGKVDDGELVWLTQGAPSSEEAYLAPSAQALLMVSGGDKTSEVKAFDWESGRVLWTTAVPGVAISRVSSVDGPVMSFMTSDNSTAWLHELVLKDGALAESPEVPPSCTMVLARRNHTLLGSRDFVGQERGLYRLSRSTMRMERLLVNDVWSLHRGGAVDVATVGDYDSDEELMVGLDGATGDILWQQPAMTELVDVQGGQVASIEAADNGRDVVVLRGAETGKELWRSLPTEFLAASQVWVATDVVLVVDVLCLRLFDRTTGDQLPTLDLPDLSDVEVRVAGGTILANLDHQMAALKKAS